MKNFFIRRSVLALPFLLGLIFFAGLTEVQAAKNYAVTTTNQLISFNTPFPGNVTTVGTITGLQAGENILGIDSRPATGELFGLGSTSRIYRISETTGAAIAVGGPFSPALSGTNFGFDFNPTVDRIRIVSDTGQNLRGNPNDGTVVVDGSINPGSPNVTAAAYTNNYRGATTTMLYVIDSATHTLFQQNPANAGTLIPVGPLGVTVSGVNGFDYNSGDNFALAALTVGGASNIYRISLTTGAATLIGPIGGGLNLRGLTGEIATPQGFNAVGLTTSNQLVTFNTTSVDVITSMKPITGLQGGENILGIDFRPATGELFGFSSANRVYRINRNSGAATSVGTLTTPISGNDFGFDFNPTVDRIRIVSNLRQNLRANPNDGSNVVDGTLTYAPGDPNATAIPNITAAAYTNSFGTATSTALFDIDSSLDILAQQNPANAGTLQTITPLGLDATNNVGFDIAGGSPKGIAAIQLEGDASSKLYVVNLTPMSPVDFIGQIGGGANPVLLRSLTLVSGGAGPTGTSKVLDFDGDGITDYTVFRPTNNTWRIRNSSDGSSRLVAFGTTVTDVFTPGDYDGDGKTDISVWRTTNQTYYTLKSSDNTIATLRFGARGDEPVDRDYDGDGKTDHAVVRRTNGQLVWYYQRSAMGGSIASVQFGAATDIVAPGDYDGDGQFDLAVRRGRGGEAAFFFVQQSTAGFTFVQFGIGGDIVAPGDYDGDGKTDYTAIRQGTFYTWFVQRSSDNGFIAIVWGAKPMFTAQGDYDGDGRTDITVWDPSTATFYVRPLTGNVFQQQWGQNGDYPVANYDSH